MIFLSIDNAKRALLVLMGQRVLKSVDWRIFMKKVLDLLSVNFIIASLSMIFFRSGFEGFQSDFYFVSYFTPIMIMLSVIVILFYYFHRDFLRIRWQQRPKIKMYLISMLPYLMLLGYDFNQCFIDADFKSKSLLGQYLINKELLNVNMVHIDINYIYVITFIIALIVLEEVVLRRFLFVELIKAYGEIKAVFITSGAFSFFTIIALFAGRSVFQTFLTMLIVYVMNVAYTSMYLYTKKLSLIIVKRTIWNTIRLSKVFIPTWGLFLIVLFELIIIINILKEYRIKKERAYETGV